MPAVRRRGRSADRVRPGGGAAVAGLLLALVLSACGATGPSAPPLPVGAAQPSPSPPTLSSDGPSPERSSPDGAATAPVNVPPASVELSGASPAPVGLADVTDDGFLDVPPDISRLGWWVGSAPMGAAAGTTLIAGHVDSAVAGLGVFARLSEMGAGDDVTVVDGLGNSHEFVVTDTEKVVKSELPTGLFDTEGERRLALVTCGGPFDPVARSYRDNLIVWAEPT